MPKKKSLTSSTSNKTSIESEVKIEPTIQKEPEVEAPKTRPGSFASLISQ